jgi:hypothetical protein
MKMLKSRININNIVAIVIAAIALLSGQGLIAASLAGFITYVINIGVVAITKMTMTKDPYILGISIIGLAINIMQYISDYSVFPAINPFYFNIALSLLIIVLRELSKDEPVA